MHVKVGNVRVAEVTERVSGNRVMPTPIWHDKRREFLQRKRRHYDPNTPLREFNQTKFPDFYIVGPQKTATSWLHVQLQMHPQVWSPIVKESLYYEEVWLRPRGSWMSEHRREAFLNSTKAENLAVTRLNGLWSDEHISDLRSLLFASDGVIDDSWYAKIFGDCGIDQVTYDASATYATLPRAALGHMRRLSPHGRIIILLRDPLARIWSYLRMRMREEKNDSLEFQLKLLKTYRGMLYWSSNYPDIVRKYRAAFGSEGVLLVDNLEISENPLSVLEKICNFVGIEFDQDFFFRSKSRIFVGKSMEIPAQTRSGVLDLLGDLRERCLSEFPSIAGHWEW